MAYYQREGELKLTSSKILSGRSRVDEVEHSNDIVATLSNADYKYRLNELS
jgi:hypothetical protein